MAASPGPHLEGEPRIWTTFSGGNTWLARRLARPIQEFLHREISGSLLMLIATGLALAWANSPWSQAYLDLLHIEVNFSFGGTQLKELDLLHIVNDGLMALFFFVVGLEIKRELVVGHLSSVRAASLPAIAAIGGMVVPALLFFSFFGFDASREGAAGWGIPMATDIAFAVGIVALLGSRVPPMLKLFLLTLAIVDDIGAIAVIAIFYSKGFNLRWALVAVALLALVRALTKLKVWSIEVYWVIGAVIWYATLESGIHATIAGVVLGLMTPARPLVDRSAAQATIDQLPANPTFEQAHEAYFEVRESVPINERLERLLHPFTVYLIVPIFAFMNAGVELSRDTVVEALGTPVGWVRWIWESVSSSDTIVDTAGSPITWGVIFGLVVGKPVGILLFTWIATRFGLELPPGMTWPRVVGMGFAAGIGFTVSLFIAAIEFGNVNDYEGHIVDLARIGILVASALAALLTLGILWLAAKSADDSGAPGPDLDDLDDISGDDFDGGDDVDDAESDFGAESEEIAAAP